MEDDDSSDEVYLDRDLPDFSRILFNDSMFYESDDADEYIERVKKRFRENDLEGAIRTCDDAIEVHDDARVYGLRGLLQGISGKQNEAVVDFTSAIDKGHATPYVYLFRAQVHGMSGNRRAEFRDIDAAFNLFQEFLPAEVGDYQGSMFAAKVGDYASLGLRVFSAGMMCYAGLAAIATESLRDDSFMQSAAGLTAIAGFSWVASVFTDHLSFLRWKLYRMLTPK